jgi:heme exporter protein B
MSLLRQTWLLLRSDLRQELRRLELLLTAAFFTLVLVLVFALSFGTLRAPLHPKAVPGMLWLALAFVGTLTLTRIFERERENSTFEALLVAPVNRLAIYFSKLAMTCFVLGLCSLVLVPGLSLIFDGATGFAARPLATACVVLLGCLGYAGVGTLFAAGLAQYGGKNVLMSVILFPLSTPVLLLALVATRRVLEAHPDTWISLRDMALLDLGIVGVAALLFESVIIGVARPRQRPTSLRDAARVGNSKVETRSTT